MKILILTILTLLAWILVFKLFLFPAQSEMHITDAEAVSVRFTDNSFSLIYEWDD
jgi:hypothetical protein